MDDVGSAMQDAAEAHLAACQEATWDEEGNERTDGESPSVAPFCGCDTCIVREVLAAAWPVVEQHFLGLRSQLVDVLLDARAMIDGEGVEVDDIDRVLGQLTSTPDFSEPLCDQLTQEQE